MGVAVEVVDAELAVASARVVRARIADAAALEVGHPVELLVKVTRARVVVALALAALVGLAGTCRLPRHVVEHGLAAFAVGARRVVVASTLAVHDAELLHVVLHLVDRNALVGVAVTQAAAAHHHLVKRVVVLLLDLIARVQQVVAERVQLGEVYAQIGDLEQVLYFARVRILQTTHINNNNKTVHY